MKIIFYAKNSQPIFNPEIFQFDSFFMKANIIFVCR